MDALVGRSDGTGPVHDEVDPALLDQCHVLDHPAQAQLADGGALPGLLVGQTLDGPTQKGPVRLQGVEQVATLEFGIALVIGHEGSVPGQSCHLPTTLQNSGNLLLRRGPLRPTSRGGP